MDKIEQIEHTFHNLVSPKRSHTFWGMMLVLLAAGAMLWLKHGEWLPRANEVMLMDSPDGFKNYMTTSWHVAHDSSYVHYEGMNYPYGEHVLFTDNQPILSAGMQWWSRHVSDIRNQAVGIMNVWQVLSMLFGAGVIFLLLRKLHLPVWYAGIAALGILFLSPQYMRFEAHFGLSHTWVLPMLLLLLCRYEERQSRRYQSLLIGILLFFAAQLHFYNFGVSALFLGLYTAYQVLTDFSWKMALKRVYHLIVMVVLPFALLNVWVHWSDYCTDRPANPYGFTTYIAHWEGIFLPYNYFPQYALIDENIVRIRRVDPESQAYIGMVAFFFTLWAVFKRRFKLFEPEWKEAAYHRVHRRYLNGVFVAGFSLVVLGCGFPFAIPGMEWLVEYLGPFRQFRGLARFTWIFYYGVNVIAFYVFWNYSVRYLVQKTWRAEWQEFQTKIRAFDIKNLPLSNLKKWSLALLPLLVICWEARVFQKYRQVQLAPSPAQKSLMAPQPDHWLNKVDFKRFQALMPIPYYHVGSENIWLDIYHPLFKKTQYTAYHTGVPDMGVFMSRSSIGRMLKSMQWALPPCQPPEMLGDLPDNRPIALMIEPSKWDEVKKKYAHLIDKATQVYDGPEMRILSLVPDSVRVYAQEVTASISQEIEAQNAKTPEWVQEIISQMGTAPDRRFVPQVVSGWKLDGNKGDWFFHDNLDDPNRPHPVVSTDKFFQGKGSGSGNLGDTTWIVREKIPKGTYQLSLWVNVAQDMGMTHEIKFVQNNLEDSHEINFRHEGLRFYIETIVDGWALFNLEFTVYEDNSLTRIYLHKQGVYAPFWYDEVMIRPKELDAYRQTPGWVAKNNWWYKL